MICTRLGQLNQLVIDAGKYYDINRQFLADPAFKTKTKTESSINMMPFINIQHNMSDYYYIIRRYKQQRHQNISSCCNKTSYYLYK